MRVFRFRLITALSLLGSSALSAQAPVDPGAAPRAVAMEQGGRRVEATEFLGRYLATAPEDGRAWFQLGRFYWLDSREWHLRGHVGDPPGGLYLDFAATALDQSIRLGSDSARVFRALVELGRMLLVVEEQGWEAARTGSPVAAYPDLPPYVEELGLNLVNSCPSGGVIVTGSAVETAGVWYTVFGSGRHTMVLPVLPDMYRSDSLYRRQVAVALGTEPSSVSLAGSAQRRPLCLSPSVDTAMASGLSWRAVRLVRVAGPQGDLTPDGLSVTELLIAGKGLASPWARDTRAVYEAAARYNSVLCISVLAQLGDRPRDACGR